MDLDGAQTAAQESDSDAMKVGSPSPSTHPLDVTNHDELTSEEHASMVEYAAAKANLAAQRSGLEAARVRLVTRERQLALVVEERRGVSREAKVLKAALDDEVADATSRVEEAKAASARVEAAVTAAVERIEAAKARDLSLRLYQEEWTTLHETKGLLVVPLAEHGLVFDHSGIAYPEDITNAADEADDETHDEMDGETDGKCDATPAGRRLMGHKEGRSVAPSIRALQDGVRGFLQRRRWRRTATGAGKAAFLECKETRALKAEANCPKQNRHADSAERNSLRDEPWGDVPKVALLFPAGGTLHVYPFDEEGERTLTLKPGDLVLFRGDLGHAGAAYDVENVRGHVYIDSKVIKRKLVDGKTATFFF
jgi:hypothetical protein